MSLGRLIDLMAVIPLLRMVAASTVLALAGCASGPTADPRDPLEPFNRGVYQFNDTVDRAVIKPVATVYRDVTPSLVRQGINNFFSNLQDGWSFVNNTLQLRGGAAADSFTRFGVNTFFGMGGIFDIASEMGVERHTKDFGHTLGRWGVGPGPYIIVPFLGPSTLRDSAAMSIDAGGNPINAIQDVVVRNSASALKLLDRRARYLEATKMLDQVALDPYTFARDAHLQRRRSAVYDGNPPDEDEPAPVADEKPSK